MKPVYLPFTYVSDPIAEALCACFTQIVIYQPVGNQVPENMLKLEKEGVLDIRTPVRGDEGKIDAICRDYREWLTIHQGGEIGVLKVQDEKIPFFSEFSSYQIIQEIKNHKQPKTRRAKAEPLFTDRIFLKIAQDYDIENWDVAQDMVFLQEMEQTLMRDLKGEDDNSAKSPYQYSPLKTVDSGEYMVEKPFFQVLRSVFSRAKSLF